MALLDWLGNILLRVTPSESLLLLCVAASVTFLARDHRLGPASVLAQHLAMALLLTPYVFGPIKYLLAGLGVAVWLVLYMSALRVARGDAITAPDAAVQNAGSKDTPTPEEPARAATPRRTLGPAQNSLVLVLAALCAFGMWRAYPIATLPEHLSLAAYWLVAMGVFLCLVAERPLRMGYGLLTLMNGIVVMYLYVERSLIVFALLGTLYALVVMGTVICTESWLDVAQAGDQS